MRSSRTPYPIFIMSRSSCESSPLVLSRVLSVDRPALRVQRSGVVSASCCGIDMESALGGLASPRVRVMRAFEPIRRIRRGQATRDERREGG